jgi:hypothetical protein
MGSSQRTLLLLGTLFGLTTCAGQPQPFCIMTVSHGATATHDYSGTYTSCVPDLIWTETPSKTEFTLDWAADGEINFPQVSIGLGFPGGPPGNGSYSESTPGVQGDFIVWGSWYAHYGSPSSGNWSSRFALVLRDVVVKDALAGHLPSYSFSGTLDATVLSETGGEESNLHIVFRRQ